MNREQLDNWLERGILGLVLGILVFGPLATGAVRPVDFLVLQGLAMLAGGLWLVRMWAAPQHRLLWPPICWVALIFIGYAVYRYSQADLEYVAREELARIIVYALVFFVVFNNLNRQEATQIVTYVLTFLAMGIALYGLYQFLTNSDHVWKFIKPYKHRASGTYINPNHFAGFLELVLPLALAYTLTGRINHVLRICMGYAGLMMIAGIGASISRGGWIATVLALLLFSLLLIRNRSFRIPALIALVVMLGGVSYAAARSEVVTKRLARSLDPGQEHYLFARAGMWGATVHMWQDNLWQGVGPGHFDYRFRQYRPPDHQVRPLYAHNDYLNTLADWGIIGTTIIMAAVVLLFIGVFKSWKFVQRSNDISTRTSNRSAFVLGGCVALVAILLHSVVDFNMHIPANAILTITIMALLSVHLRFASERYWITPGLALRLAVTAVVLLGLAWLGREGWTRYRETMALNRADAAEQKAQQLMTAIRDASDGDTVDFDLVAKMTSDLRARSEQAVAALKEANQIDPANFDTTYRIGEAERATGWGRQGEPARQALKNAMQWYERGMAINRFDPYNHLRDGMCLDQLGDHAAAWAHYQRALELDPNGYYTLAHIGWHYVQMGDYATALPWFEKSLKYKLHDGADGNPVAWHYIQIIKARLAEAKPGAR